MNEETGNGKNWDKEIVKGNDENVKTIDGNLDESKADQTELMKVELSKFDETGICKTGEKWKLWEFLWERWLVRWLSFCSNTLIDK